MDLETKAVTPEMKSAFDDFLCAFETFKQANDERLAELETRSADVITEEKVDRINRALDEQKRQLDELTLAAARPQLSGERKSVPRGEREAKAAFERYVRQGDSSGLIEAKAMSTSTASAGGYTVPLEIEQTIDRVLAKVSPIRAIATVRQIGSNVYRKPITTAGAATGWVAETDARPQTNTPTLTAIDFATMELYAMPAATQGLLDDSQVDLETWLAEEVQTVFAEQEGAAFISGNGTTQPKGFLTETAIADGSWAWGKLGYVASGADGAFASTTPSDALISLVYAPKQAYRANGSWLMNRKSESAIRKLKDGQNNYIWQPGTSAGQPATLLGYPVVEAEDMPDIASGSFAIAFGDFKRGYLIVDRVGVRVLRDPYSAKPYVLFYTTKRVGGGVQNYEAIKLMKFAVS
ncbi:HK97 family phage major capsid protein [Rhizomicrobium palustre]|uniref:HK97 family phage major capsid protein n=1 Tax=Rhizomicrobium palustre TaxID=189966 RepID=A0A846MW70_9PROT|nr:phage major capsid protein [Rhizomicrobium palustre]NIK87636.1 HK97 family phage major capsid protein [Rhizomicrobium palustre]